VKTSSCKAKGRRCSQDVKDLLILHANNLIHPDDIVVTPSGVTGPDVLFSPLASRMYPFIVECKNQERISIWEALKQSESHMRNQSNDKFPILFFKRNHSDLYVSLKADTFIHHFRTKRSG